MPSELIRFFSLSKIASNLIIFFILPFDCMSKRLMSSYQDVSLDCLICIMLFNMNNQIQACSNPQANCLQAQQYFASHLYHSNIFSPIDNSSIIKFASELELDDFSLINSFSPQHISLRIHHQPNLIFNSERPNEIDLTCFQNATLPYLNLSMGISENSQCCEEQQRALNHPLFNPISTYQDQSCQNRQQNKGQGGLGMSPPFLSSQSSEQDLKSSQKQHPPYQYNPKKPKDDSPTHQTGLKVTKNVTKNIGKLLFKFIWKNKETLAHDIGVSPERWEFFIEAISAWKKQNNITRQFLINKWHGHDEDCHLFRIISRHFFRKRCLPAVMNSHIRLKKVHYERISRFSMAIVDPKALHSIA